MNVLENELNSGCIVENETNKVPSFMDIWSSGKKKNRK